MLVTRTVDRLDLPARHQEIRIDADLESDQQAPVVGP